MSVQELNGTDAVGTSDSVSAVRLAAKRAAAAAPGVRAATGSAVDDMLRTAARLLRERTDDVLAANAVDIATAEAGHMGTGLLDRLRLTPERFEARPNVTIDVASQVLKARSAAVLRTGAAALESANALIEFIVRPALNQCDLPVDAVQLVPTPGHDGAEALMAMPELVPVVVVRGSGEVTRRLAALGAAAGTRVLVHAAGGGVLYLDKSAAETNVIRLVESSTDRLGVCNRLNLLLIDGSAFDRLWPVAERVLRIRGIEPSLPPHTYPLGYEWALDTGAEAHVTVAAVQGPVHAARTASQETSGLAASVCTTDASAAAAFIDAYTGTAVFWNASTRLLDGYKLLGLPETGINVDHAPGPRGPVTYLDLSLRQYVLLPNNRCEDALDRTTRSLAHSG